VERNGDMTGESPWRRWGRRAVTFSVLMLLAIAVAGSLPVLVFLALCGDLLRPRRFALTRCTLLLALYLVCEVLGLIAALGVWLASGVWAGASRARFLRWNVALQGLWAATLYHGAARLFGWRTVIEGREAVRTGRVLVLIRHVSSADTVVPVTFLGRPAGLALRYVLKEELLWDPCLDVVGNRLPNHFVRRGSGDGEREVAAIQRLLDGLGPRDGVLIYPEGTRFSAAKRARILAGLAARGDRAAYDAAAGLRHVLPPRLGGTLGLLERNPGADVVFCAHVGLERASTIRHLLGGAPVGATVRVRFWRVPYAEIPLARADQVRWLYDWWQRIDRWVDASVAAAPAAPAGAARAA
jgi:1-acyl-sn-glycerol-3-phosphate acyltransferase